MLPRLAPCHTNYRSLEKIINDWKHIVLFISHDETLIERTANMVIHIEQIIRKTKARYTVAKLPYRRYVEERLHKFEIQKQRALSDRREKKIRDEKYQRVMQSVQGALRSCTRQAPSVAKNLKDKMHTVKAMERRFEKEDEKVPSIGEITSKSWSPKTSTISSDTSSSSGDLDIPTFLRKNKGK